MKAIQFDRSRPPEVGRSTKTSRYPCERVGIDFVAPLATDSSAPSTWPLLPSSCSRCWPRRIRGRDGLPRSRR